MISRDSEEEVKRDTKDLREGTKSEGRYNGEGEKIKEMGVELVFLRKEKIKEIEIEVLAKKSNTEWNNNNNKKKNFADQSVGCFCLAAYQNVIPKSKYFLYPILF